MGKNSKSSRKGKKAWRANKSTEDIEDYLDNTTKDALSGGPLTHLPTDSLFFVDKSTDLSVKRKIEKHREKVLRCDSILKRNSFVQPVSSSTQKKSKRIEKPKDVDQDCGKKDASSDTAMVDLWEDKGEQARIKKMKSKSSIIPAVEVEPPGCSFNPSSESHQDSLARAVADEMQKIYRHELGPEPVPLTVPGEAVAEEDMYFLDADNGSDADQDSDNEDKDGKADNENRSARAKRVTRVEQNKRIRRKEVLKAEAKIQKVEKLAKQIDSLPDILEEISKEDDEKQRRHLRRAVAKHERLKTRPPRLGRHKFAAAPLQVLLSEEITGSLRKIKGCPTLTKDRFKSLEKRGLVAPTAKTSRK